MPYEVFWHLNPRKLAPFYEGYRQRIEREWKMQDRASDILAWRIGNYVQRGVAALFPKGGRYPAEPLTITAAKTESQTAADNFRSFLRHYKRAKPQGR